MRSIIKPGQLNEMLTIQKSTGAIDENGFPVETLDDVAILWCDVRTVSTKEAIESNRLGATLAYKFIVPREGLKIDNDMFVLYDDKQWNIKHIHFIDDFHYELTAELNK